MAKRQLGAGEAERTVHFFRVNIGFDAAGEPEPFPVANIAARINELDWNTGQRYLRLDDDVVTACWVDRDGPEARIRITNVRRRGLPEVDEQGNLTPLAIPGNAGLAEATHVRFFPNNIVGVLFNFYGPRPSRFAYYLAVHASDLCPVARFEPLLRHDVLDRINDLQRITLFRLKIRRGYLAELERANASLARAFDTLFEAGDGESAEIVLQAGRKRRSSLSLADLRRTARRLIGRNDLSEGVTRFVVRGQAQGAEKIEEIDVLSDELLLRKTVRLQDERTRAVTPASAYRAIEEAYVQLEPQLNDAAQIAFQDDNA
jgi:hypothetical protein